MATKTTSTSTRPNPGRYKDRFTKLVAKYEGDARGEALAKALRRRGYRVDVAKGLRAVHFIERRCRHTKAPYYGVKFSLRPWQFVIVFTFFGVVHDDGSRLFKKLWLEVAKKNGKTELIAAILLYCLFGLEEYGGEVYSAAAAKKQARQTYKVMASMVRQDPVLRKRAKLSDAVYTISVAQLDAVYEVMSADADYNDGVNPSAVGVDEVHRHKSRALYDVLEQGQGTRLEPVFISITTAGSGRDGLAWDEHQHADQVINGLIEDEALLAFIYSVPEEADWLDEAQWPLANPALGDFLRIEDLRGAIAKAHASPTSEHSVRRLRLNQWVAAETKWLDLRAWDECAGLGLVEEHLEKGRPFYGGFDISHSADFTAWSMVFPWPDEASGELAVDVVVRFWLPEEGVAKLRPQMRPTIETWARQGFITIVPGEVVDLRMMRDQILRDCETFACKQIGFDRFHAHGIVSELMEEGLDLVDVGQMFRSMNAPCKELERMLARRLIRHGGNPVLRWMAANVVAEMNQDDLIRPSRKHSTDKIDGVVAMLMALERAMHEEQQPEVAFYSFGD